MMTTCPGLPEAGEEGSEDGADAVGGRPSLRPARANFRRIGRSGSARNRVQAE